MHEVDADRRLRGSATSWRPIAATSSALLTTASRGGQGATTSTSASAGTADSGSDSVSAAFRSRFLPFSRCSRAARWSSSIPRDTLQVLAGNVDRSRSRCTTADAWTSLVVAIMDDQFAMLILPATSAPAPRPHTLQLTLRTPQQPTRTLRARPARESTPAPQHTRARTAQHAHMNWMDVVWRRPPRATLPPPSHPLRPDAMRCTQQAAARPLFPLARPREGGTLGNPARASVGSPGVHPPAIAPPQGSEVGERGAREPSAQVDIGRRGCVGSGALSTRRSSS